MAPIFRPGHLSSQPTHPSQNPAKALEAEGFGGLHCTTWVWAHRSQDAIRSTDDDIYAKMGSDVECRQRRGKKEAFATASAASCECAKHREVQWDPRAWWSLSTEARGPGRDGPWAKKPSPLWGSLPRGQALLTVANAQGPKRLLTQSQSSL